MKNTSRRTSNGQIIILFSLSSSAHKVPITFHPPSFRPKQNQKKKKKKNERKRTKQSKSTKKKPKKKFKKKIPENSEWNAKMRFSFSSCT